MKGLDLLEKPVISRQFYNYYVFLLRFAGEVVENYF